MELFSLPLFYHWTLGVPAVYIILAVFFRSFNSLSFPTPKGGRTSNAIAFLCTSSLCVLYLTVAGTIGFLSPENQVNQSNPFYAYSEFFNEHLALPMFAYQLWNFACCMLLPDLRQVELIGHHAIAFVVAAISTTPFLHGYGCFFFGVVEVTNLPLNAVEFITTFEGRPQYKRLSGVHFLLKATFALTFLFIRIVAWTAIGWEYWLGSIQLLRDGNVPSTFNVAFCFACHAAMTALQYFWAWRIVGIAVMELCSKKPAQTSEAVQTTEPAAILASTATKKKSK